MILQAQMDAEEIDPYLQEQDMAEAEEKRKKLEGELENLNKEWFGKVDALKQEIERNLGENEKKEFGSRLASLTAELNDKNK